MYVTLNWGCNLTGHSVFSTEKTRDIEFIKQQTDQISKYCVGIFEKPEATQLKKQSNHANYSVSVRWNGREFDTTWSWRVEEIDLCVIKCFHRTQKLKGVVYVVDIYII